MYEIYNIQFINNIFVCNTGVCLLDVQTEEMRIRQRLWPWQMLHDILRRLSDGRTVRREMFEVAMGKYRLMLEG